MNRFTALLQKLRAWPWARICLSTLCAILSIVLVVMIISTVYVHKLLGKINRLDSDETQSTDPGDYTIGFETMPPDFTGPVIDPTEVTIPVVTGPVETVDHIINIMLVGQDRRPGNTRRTLSDTMILCTINTNENTIILTSFLRDIYVYIPGYSKGYNKLNAAYKIGGTDMLADTMLVNFGIEINHFVVVDFNGFKDIVNAIGGIDMELTAKEAEYMNTFTWDGLDSTGWNLKKGMNHLNGDMALAYSRIRHVATSTGSKYDFGRTERQRKVLTAIMEKYRNSSFDQLWSLLNTLLPLISTDMSNSEITSLAMSLLPMLQNTNMTNQQIPIAGSYESAYVGKANVIMIDFEKNREFLKEILSGE